MLMRIISPAFNFVNSTTTRNVENTLLGQSLAAFRFPLEIVVVSPLFMA